jgi:hypothetical protein
VTIPSRKTNTYVPELLSPINFDPFKEKPEKSEPDKAPYELEYVLIKIDPKEEPDPNPPSPPPSSGSISSLMGPKKTETGPENQELLKSV